MANGKSGYWRTPEGLLLIEGWARDGLTDEQIARNIGIARKTLYDWKSRYSDICNALKRGKEVVDREVENALLKKALGYTIDLKKTFKVRNVVYKDGKKVEEREELVQGIDQMHVPADTTAQIFWLKNRKPEQYREKRDAELERDGADTGVLMMPEVMRPE